MEVLEDLRNDLVKNRLVVKIESGERGVESA